MTKVPGVEIRKKSIRLRFTYNGKPYWPTLQIDGVPLLPTPANIRYAQQLSVEIRQKIKFGVFSMEEYFPENSPANDLTLKSWFQTYLSAQRVELSTRDGYNSATRFWAREFDDTLIADIKQSSIKQVLARSTLSGKTLNNYLSVLRQALALAHADGIINSNPAADIPNVKYQKPTPDPFSHKEIEQIIKYMQRNYPREVVNFVEFWFFTGLRTSEIFALRWPSVELHRKEILIHEAIVRGVRKNTTKTHMARRVFLNSRSYRALKRQERLTNQGDTHVWVDPRYGTPWVDERAFRRSFWAPALESLGIRYRRPYNMRHSYATTMLMAGMTPAFCADQLGNSVEIFLQAYAKWLDSGHSELEMQRLEDSLESLS